MANEFDGLVNFLGTSDPLTVDLKKLESLQGRAVDENPALSSLSTAELESLTKWLVTRLGTGGDNREARVSRYQAIDRAISTWQKLSPDDSERARAEDNSGKQYALPLNLPILSGHLDDMASYFAEALAPISNPFTTADGDDRFQELTRALNKDALARDYYGELVLTIRSLLKYNVGGLTVEWEEVNGATGVQPEGNSWKSLIMHNTLWDSSIKDPRHVSYKAEWAAYVCEVNRLEIVRKAVSGEWVNLETYMEHPTLGYSLYRDPSHAVPTIDGRDARTYANGETISTEQQWQEFGLGDSFGGEGAKASELTRMYCWIVPDQFGLLGENFKAELENRDMEPSGFLELWQFEIINAQTIVSARPVLSRTITIDGTRPRIPMYMAYMTSDQLGEAQRSTLELMNGLQRFSSAMMNIYVAGMRNNVWGTRAYDPQMFDGEQLKTGDTAGLLKSKLSGRDVRTGLMRLDSSSGVGEALQGVNSALDLKQNLFPSQGLPNQVAGMDRAVTSQVATVVQGAQRSMRMLLRLLDSSLMMPTRIQAFQNLKAAAAGVYTDVTEEDVAKSFGSGIESMEAERITEALWRLLNSIVQNQEAAQTFNVPVIMAYLGRTLNLSADMSQFVRQPEQPPQGEGAPPPAPGQPPVA